VLARETDFPFTSPLPFSTIDLQTQAVMRFPSSKEIPAKSPILPARWLRPKAFQVENPHSTLRPRNTVTAIVTDAALRAPLSDESLRRLAEETITVKTCRDRHKKYKGQVLSAQMLIAEC